MIANQSQNYISPEEYLKSEELSQVKHEYIQGETYAMAGASDAHVTIIDSIYEDVVFTNEDIVLN